MLVHDRNPSRICDGVRARACSRAGAATTRGVVGGGRRPAVADPQVDSRGRSRCRTSGGVMVRRPGTCRTVMDALALLVTGG
jgi:hypothetical protein